MTWRAGSKNDMNLDLEIKIVEYPPRLVLSSRFLDRFLSPTHLRYNHEKRHRNGMSAGNLGGTFLAASHAGS